MANAYRELKQRQEQAINAFPFVWAFSEKQFAENVRSKWGLDPEKDLEKICSIGGGGYIRKADREELEALLERNRAELQEAIAADQTGEGFIFDMFNYELGNHEYIVTGDIAPTLRALGLTVEEVNASKALLTGLKKAVNNQSEEYSY